MSHFPALAIDASTHQFAAQWHAVYTRHQHEKVAARILGLRGFETFLPTYTEIHQWKDRRKKVVLPLFPCYVFLRGIGGRQFDVLNTPGVHAVVSTAGRAAVIPDEEMDAIRHVLESRSHMEPCPYLQCGEAVRVRSGPLQGVEGIFIRKKEGGSRLILSVELLKRSVAVEVEESSVEAVAPRKSAIGINGNIADLAFDRTLKTLT